MYTVWNLLLGIAFIMVATTDAARPIKYKSQYGQDKYVNKRFFKNKKHGIFIDIGAHDGKTISNTWFFEKGLGWSGICFEPQPEIFKKLVSKRNCIRVLMLPYLIKKDLLNFGGSKEAGAMC